MVLTTSETIVECTCSKCGTKFGMTESYTSRRKSDRETFYCPNGHGQWFPGKTDAQKFKEGETLRIQMAEFHRQETARLRDQIVKVNRERSAAKGQVTKIKNRVGRGVCPCCNRQFENLHRHMAGQHPEFVSGENVVA